MRSKPGGSRFKSIAASCVTTGADRCLAGVLSTRMYLKQANHHAQLTLEKFAEPFAAFAMQAGLPYPQEYLHYAWKLLMRNHPHDSICGCSIDQVHREMVPRFAQVDQIGEELIARSLQPIADRAAFSQEAGRGETGLVVFNSLNWPRTDPVRAALAFPLGTPTRGNPLRDDSLQVAGISLIDSGGAQIPFVVLDNSVKMRQVLSPVELPWTSGCRRFRSNSWRRMCPPAVTRSYRVIPSSAMPSL